MRSTTIMIAIAGLALAAMAWHDAAMNYALAADPELGIALFGADPRLELAVAERAAQAGRSDASNRPSLVEDAEATLRKTPLRPFALVQLALAMEAGSPLAQQRLRLAERLSRREALTQTVSLRLAALKGDYSATLTHLDRILSVWPQSMPLYADGIVGLVADPEGRRALASLSSRSWFAPIAARAIEQTENPIDGAKLVALSRLPADSRARLVPRVLRRFVAARQFDAARRFAIDTGGATAATLDDLGLGDIRPALAPLGWQLGTADGLQITAEAGGALFVGVRPGTATRVLDRVTLLPPGHYVLEQRLSGDAGGTAITPEWEAACLSSPGSPEIWRQQVPPRQDDKRYRSAITIPADCIAQVWRLRAAAGDGQASAGFRISDLRLLRDDPGRQVPDAGRGHD